MRLKSKDDYLSIAKTQSVQEAVNQLHKDLWEIETECFETQSGYDPNLWKQLNELRLFSRELWDLKLSPEYK